MKDEYARAGVPMLPVVRGERETRRQILLYTVLLYAVSQLPFCAGAFGVTYLVASVLLGAAFIFGAARLVRQPERRTALRLYLFSLAYLARCSRRWWPTCGSERAAARRPAKKLAVVACMDARVNVERILGLEEGDAHVIRQRGRAVTDDVKRSLEASRSLGTERGDRDAAHRLRRPQRRPRRGWLARRRPRSAATPAPAVYDVETRELRDAVLADRRRG